MKFIQAGMRGSKMRFFKIEYGTPYCGIDEVEYLKFPDDYTDEEVYDYAEDLALDHSESYGFEEDEDSDAEEEKYWFHANEIKETDIPDYCSWKIA